MATQPTPQPSGQKPVPEVVRDELALIMPATTDIVNLLVKQAAALIASGAATNVAKQSDLIPVLAADMARKAGKPGQASAYMNDAKQQIEGNQTTALTTSDDRYTGIAGGEMFDAIHELIHICSAPGGESPQHKFCLNFNEGAINYFSELVAPHCKDGVNQVKVVTRYPEQTNFVKGMLTILGPSGPAVLFESTFQGKIDEFFAALGKAYCALPNKLPNGKTKARSEQDPGFAATAAETFKSKVKDWNISWMKNHF